MLLQKDFFGIVPCGLSRDFVVTLWRGVRLLEALVNVMLLANAKNVAKQESKKRKRIQLYNFRERMHNRMKGKMNIFD